jgi:UDPglucose 6-dehydrogenase
MMKISVVGAGYVGLVTALGWASKGHEVACIDVDKKKVDMINAKQSPFFEDGIWKNLESLDVRAYSSFEPVNDSDVVFIAVGTPPLSSGGIDLGHIKACSESIAESFPATEFPIIVVRSTVIPGTTENTIVPILEKNGLRAGVDFGVAMMPEFLRQGTAFSDFSSPDRIVVGYSDKRTKEKIGELVNGFDCPKLFTGIRTAELIKYASNAMLATRVAFTNEMAKICEQCGADVDDVMEGVGLDKRIGRCYLEAGPGFGGSCLPKDVSALYAFSGSELMKVIMETNESQVTDVVSMMEKKLGSLSGKRIAVLGLAFKHGTDDVRTSRSIEIIKALVAKGAVVIGCDPKAAENTRKLLGIETCGLGKISGCDAALLLTAWPEFREDAKFYKKLLKDSPLFDMRRILNQDDAINEKLNYHAFGRGVK